MNKQILGQTIETSSFSTEEQAIKAWNRRVKECRLNVYPEGFPLSPILERYWWKHRRNIIRR